MDGRQEDMSNAVISVLAVCVYKVNPGTRT
jgi:hypothetical protein